MPDLHERVIGRRWRWRQFLARLAPAAQLPVVPASRRQGTTEWRCRVFSSRLSPYMQNVGQSRKSYRMPTANGRVQPAATTPDVCSAAVAAVASHARASGLSQFAVAEVSVAGVARTTGLGCAAVVPAIFARPSGESDGATRAGPTHVVPDQSPNCCRSPQRRWNASCPWLTSAIQWPAVRRR